MTAAGGEENGPRRADEGGALERQLRPALAAEVPSVGTVLRRGFLASREPAAWLDLAGMVGLRMDDPGASASVHLEGWCYEKAEPRVWQYVGELLERERARVSIGYTPGWVDDGDEDRGDLLVGGATVDRVPGRVHPSPLVTYRGRTAPSGDFAAEFAAMRELAERGVASIELHGYTHVHPDRERWARSPTAHTKVGWYRELGPETVGALASLPPERHPLSLGYALLREHLGGAPSALLCPGNACADEVADHAFELGLDAVAARRLALPSGTGFAWLSEIPNIPLSASPAQAFESDGPVIGEFHDRDIALHGPEWLDDRLGEWRRAGARRFVDIAELSSILGLSIELKGHVRQRLRVQRIYGPALPRSACAYVRAASLADEILLETAAGEERIATEAVADRLWRVELPPGL